MMMMANRINPNGDGGDGGVNDGLTVACRSQGHQEGHLMT